MSEKQRQDWEDWWAFHRSEFEWMAENIRNVVLQTKKEALKGEWFGGGSEHDEETGATKVGIPYSTLTVDDHLPSQIEHARSIIPDLERQFEKRELTPDLVTGYAALAEVFGFVSAIAMATEDRVEGERNRRKGTEASKRKGARRWVALHLLPLLETTKRARTEDIIARGIETIIEAGEFPEGYPKSWFTKLLRYDEGKPYLVSTLTQKYASKPKLKAWAADESTPVPDIEIPIPKT